MGKNAVAISYKYKEVGFDNLTELRWAKVQLGRFMFLKPEDEVAILWERLFGLRFGKIFGAY